MKIIKKGDKIIVEIPYWSPRSNPYMDGCVGKHPTLTGLIVKHRKDGNNYDEMGLSAVIDMDYAGKGDQIGDFVIMWHRGEDEFRKICKRLKLPVNTMEL